MCDSQEEGSGQEVYRPAGTDDRNQTNGSGRESPSISEGSWVAETGCLGSRCCDPKQGPYRFLGLVFMLFLSFGNTFCYDTPGSLQNEIKTDMNVSTLQFSTLYSLYSWPNVVLCFVGGFLIDRIFGIRLGTLIFSTIVTVGHFVFSFGALINTFWCMQLGRFIFGIGGESLIIAQNAYTVSWFKGKELNTVFGLIGSLSRVGSTVNFLVMEPIYNWVDQTQDGHVTLGITLAIGGFTCVFSLTCAIVLAILDRRRSKVLRVASAEVGEKIQLKDIGKFPLSFWLISVICFTFYPAIFPFVGLSKVFFMYKYGLSSAKANSVSSIAFIISAFASPMFGFVVDKTGRNIMWVGLACLVTMGAHAIMAFTFINPYIPMCIMSLSCSLMASSLLPMVALILPESQLGTAYGIMLSFQNLGLALISMLSGFVVDNYGYLMLEVLNLICLSLAVGSTGVIYVVDMIQDGGYLMKPNKERGIVSPRVEKLMKEAALKKISENEDKDGKLSKTDEGEKVVMEEIEKKKPVDQDSKVGIAVNEGYETSEDEPKSEEKNSVAIVTVKASSDDHEDDVSSSSSDSEVSARSSSSGSSSISEVNDEKSVSSTDDEIASRHPPNDDLDDSEKITCF
ncbi:major facilitator superfamily domain-containing protein 1-like [Hyalella azteca]|uniref:Lysosomal dipeptide transporter MFSD1 n=1 Tax=Hyalella azteca TaxID=294128 RepID=A0A8B7NTR5_HYAAZ|nr:major facilitator superfamily domain-containing protein 1-like [Hyalella azteca]XP_018017100.1 major facilitator superfamily domain-containing protein 1-like [Hyalella azteca]